MMATNNNEARKKQKITEAAGNGGDSSLPTPPAVVVLPVLSFGNILKEFQDLLFCVLPYIADRLIWNSIASSNKDMHEKSKTILPPWPLCYKLPRFSDLWSWSPCGSRIACAVHTSNIVIIDQRRGPLRNNGHINSHHGREITNLKYSPNGRFLVSTGYDGFVKLWDNVTGNYELMQEWNMREVFTEEALNIVDFVDVSRCSKYIAVSLETCVFLKDVEGKTIKSLILPFAPNENRTGINNIQFLANDRAVFICRNGMIQVWHPYLDDDDKDHLITLWRRTDNFGFQTITFSNDSTMVAIHTRSLNKGILWSIDMDHNCLTQELQFQAEGGQKNHFTPDDKYIVCSKGYGPTLWSTAEGKFTNNTLHFLKNRNITKSDLVVEEFSPNNRQLIVWDEGSDTRSRYILSYFLK